jgi:hypothetical protein
LGRRLGFGSYIMIHRCPIALLSATLEPVSPSHGGKGAPLYPRNI